MKPNTSVPGHFLEGRLARNWTGVDYGSREGSTCVTNGDVKPLHFLELVAPGITQSEGLSFEKDISKAPKGSKFRRQIKETQYFSLLTLSPKQVDNIQSHEGLVLLG